jgi:hypothetical protein
MYFAPFRFIPASAFLRPDTLSFSGPRQYGFLLGQQVAKASMEFA